MRAQQQTQARRVLVMMGLAHVGVLEELFAANPNYRVVHAYSYLKTSYKHSMKAANARPSSPC